MKICTKCRVEKEFVEFRWRTSKKQKPHYNSQCRSCECKWARDNKSIISRSSEYRKEYKSKIKEKTKQYNHDYSLKNRASLSIYKRDEMRKKRDELHDLYIVKLLSGCLKVKATYIRQYPEFIEAWKINLKFKRELQNEQNPKCETTTR